MVTLRHAQGIDINIIIIILDIITIIITIIAIIIIIITRPKPPFGRQGLAGSWGKYILGSNRHNEKHTAYTRSALDLATFLAGKIISSKLGLLLRTLKRFLTAVISFMMVKEVAA